MLQEMSDRYIKKVFYEDDDVCATLEQLDGELMVHFHADNFSNEILTKLRAIWDQIVEGAYWQGYEKISTYTSDPRTYKLFKGWYKLGEFERAGQIFEVVAWDLK